MSAMNLQMLLDLDIKAAREFCPCMPDGTPMSDEGLLAGLHKTRLHHSEVPLLLREQSLAWLRANGFRDIGGAPLPNEVPL